MSYSWKSKSIVLGITALALILIGTFTHQTGIHIIGNLVLGMAIFSSGCAFIEENARRKAQHDSVIG